MPHIGNRIHAAQILNDYHASCISHDWERIGSGGFRVVFLHKPTGVVYKIGHSSYSSSHENPSEVNNARTLLRKCLNNDQWINPHVRIPKVSGFTINGEVVVAMQFIVGTLGRQATTSEESRKALYSLRFGDMHGENFIVDADGTIWPIDMASPRPGSCHYEGADARALSPGGGFAF